MILSAVLTRPLVLDGKPPKMRSGGAAFVALVGAEACRIPTGSSLAWEAGILTITVAGQEPVKRSYEHGHNLFAALAAETLPMELPKTPPVSEDSPKVPETILEAPTALPEQHKPATEVVKRRSHIYIPPVIYPLCSICKTTKVIKAHEDGQEICSLCRKQMPCKSCGLHPAYPTEDRDGLCGGCRRKTQAKPCSKCQTRTTIKTDRVCSVCTKAERDKLVRKSFHYRQRLKAKQAVAKPDFKSPFPEEAKILENASLKPDVMEILLGEDAYRQHLLTQALQLLTEAVRFDDQQKVTETMEMLTKVSGKFQGHR